MMAAWHRIVAAWLRDMNRATRDARERDRPARWARLSPESAADWCATLRRAGPIARDTPGRRPCDPAPWTRALEACGAEPGALMVFAAEAGYAGWPEENGHLRIFALTFLEEDPMLFRSGYAKRHLANRLRQCALGADEVARLDPLLRRVVSGGTGLEEFRALCRLARRHRPEGLWTWLAEQEAAHPDPRVRRNARYMRRDDLPWWQMHRCNERSVGLEPP